MAVGIIMMSASVYFFQTPNDLTLGGIAGIAIVLNKLIYNASPDVAAILTQGVIMAIINVLLLVLGLIILGKQCTVKTIFCSLLYTGIIWLLEYFNVISYLTPVNEAGVHAATLTDQPLLELVYAILLFGVGGALIFNCGASSGGTDIIALILKKFTRLNVGMALMLIDFFNRVHFVLHIRRGIRTVLHARLVYEVLPFGQRNRKYKQDQIHYHNHAQSRNSFGLYFKCY